MSIRNHPIGRIFGVKACRDPETRCALPRRQEMIWPIASAPVSSFLTHFQQRWRSRVTRPGVSHQSFGHHANSCRLSAPINDYRSEKTKRRVTSSLLRDDNLLLGPGF